MLFMIRSSRDAYHVKPEIFINAALWAVWLPISYVYPNFASTDVQARFPLVCLIVLAELLVFIISNFIPLGLIYYYEKHVDQKTPFEEFDRLMSLGSFRYLYSLTFWCIFYDIEETPSTSFLQRDFPKKTCTFTKLYNDGKQSIHTQPTKTPVPW